MSITHIIMLNASYLDSVARKLLTLSAGYIAGLSVSTWMLFCQASSIFSDLSSTMSLIGALRPLSMRSFPFLIRRRSFVGRRGSAREDEDSSDNDHLANITAS